MEKPHILLVVFPSQGHINPSLEFAKRLVRKGLQVTFATSVSATKRMSKNTTSLQGLSYATFSDGRDDGFKADDEDLNSYMLEVARCGSQNLKKLILNYMDEGCCFTCVVYSMLVTWAAKVARELHIPSTLLWDQPATLFDIYYYYSHGYGDVIRDSFKDPLSVVNLPNLPPFTIHDLPSFFIPGCPLSFALDGIKDHFDVLDREETKPKILVNTFNALESGALNAIDRYNVVGVGPLLPSAFLDGVEPSDNSFGGDLFKSSKDYINWLATKPEASVIYIAFGSLTVLTMPQMEEMARGLLDTGRPFLWVIREDEGEEKQKDKLSCREELEKKGMIVPWCSQVEVLSHQSIGCFVTHCGWNSTLESLASGVPTVGFPQWTDQSTNAKLVEQVWKTGVRVTKNENGVVESNEIYRCLELVMGSEEMRSNAKKWKESARGAAREGGSSDQNLKDFADEVTKICGHHA